MNELKMVGPDAKGLIGVRFLMRGYVYISDGKSGIAEHRMMAEKKLGRPLLKGEIVHHIDSNRSNNSPENLEIITRSEHIDAHKINSNTHGAQNQYFRPLRQWTPEEDQTIRTMAQMHSATAIGHALHSCCETVEKRARELNVTLRPRKGSFSPEEERNLRELVMAGFAKRQIARTLERSEGSVNNKMKRMGIRSPNAGKTISAKEDQEILKLQTEGMSHAKIGMKLHRSKGTIRWRIERMKRLNNSQPKTVTERRPCTNGGRTFTPEEDQIIQEMLAHGEKYADIARQVNRKHHASVMTRAKLLGIYKRRYNKRG